MTGRCSVCGYRLHPAIKARAHAGCRPIRTADATEVRAALTLLADQLGAQSMEDSHDDD